MADDLDIINTIFEHRLQQDDLDRILNALSLTDRNELINKIGDLLNRISALVEVSNSVSSRNRRVNSGMYLNGPALGRDPNSGFGSEAVIERPLRCARNDEMPEVAGRPLGGLLQVRNLT